MVYLGLGSNIGNGKAYFSYAIEKLRKIGYQIRMSSYYRSEPLEDINQPLFLNAALEFNCPEDPHFLLNYIHEIEQEAGRVRIKDRRYGPRTLDIDILLFNDVVIDEIDLTIPHPKISERLFVLAPLLELNYHLINPVTGDRFSICEEKLAYQFVVREDL